MKVVELCAGVGGLGIPFAEEGFELELAVDCDKYAVESYRANVSDKIICSTINSAMNDIPFHDILLAGIPCPSWSTAGKQKGFEDPRGKVFYDVLDVVRNKKPKVIVIENVMGMLSHEKGETFRYILQCLNTFGYRTFYDVLDSQDFGVPQRRKRVFIICFHKDYFKNIPFEFPKGKKLKITLQDILETEVPTKYFLTEETKKRVLDVPSNRNGDLSEVPINQKIAKTLLTTSGNSNKCTKNNYVIDVENAIDSSKSDLRCLTPTECLRLQGFDTNDWKQVVSDTQLYKQAGNAVTINVAREIAKCIKKYIKDNCKGE